MAMIYQVQDGGWCFSLTRAAPAPRHWSPADHYWVKKTEVVMSNEWMNHWQTTSPQGWNNPPERKCLWGIALLRPALRVISGVLCMAGGEAEHGVSAEADISHITSLCPAWRQPQTLSSSFTIWCTTDYKSWLIDSNNGYNFYKLKST